MNYSPDMLAKAQSYLRNWKRRGDKLPTLVGLASALKVPYHRVATWSREDADFRLVVDALVTERQRQLLNATFEKNPNNAAQLIRNGADAADSRLPSGREQPDPAVPKPPMDTADPKEVSIADYQDKVKATRKRG